MSKRDADNARVAAAMRRRQCQFEVAAEKSRSRWASKKEIVRRYQRKQVTDQHQPLGPVVWLARPCSRHARRCIERLTGIRLGLLLHMPQHYVSARRLPDGAPLPHRTTSG